MKNQRWKTWFLIVLCLGGFAASAWVAPTINRKRAELKLEYADIADKEQTASELRLPLAALFVFRSLAIDYLWIRADKLKNDGQYFDALHLARLICELQPHIAQVWDFQAWNMAYNISVAMPTPPERWNWVYAGYTLLRDKGLLYNPTDPVIYESLAWILRHKIGGISDDYNRYYKLRLAFEIMSLLGEQSNEHWQELANAPTQWDDLKKEPDIAQLMESLKQANPDFKSDQQVFDGLLDFKVKPNEFPPAMHQVLANMEGTKAFKQLDSFICARQLRDVWKMDIHKIIQINKTYGPIDFNTDENLSLDWRLPWPHAIYWATEGLQFAKDKDFNETQLHRSIYQSLQDLYHYGHLGLYTTLPPEAVTRGEKGQQVFEKQMLPQIQIFLSQDLRMFPIAYQATLEVIELFKDANKRLSGGVVQGSINMARSGIVNLYLSGHRAHARKYLLELGRRYPDNESLQLPLEEFIRNEMRQAVEEIGPKDASDYINALLRQSYTRYALRDDENAAIREKLAEQIADLFWKDYADEAARFGLLDFSKMRWIALKDFISDPEVDFNIKGYLMQRLKTDDPEKYNRIIADLKKEKVIPETSEKIQ